MSRQKIFQIEGLVLGKFDHSERDTVFSLLTRERGRMLVLAKYAKNVPSRHNAGLDLFNVVRCQLYEGRFLPVVTQVRQLSSFTGLFASLSRLELAYKFALLAQALVQTGQGSKEAYDLAIWCLRRISRTEGNEALSTFIQAAFQLLGIAGSLHWSRVCQQCGEAFGSRIHCCDSRFLCASCAAGTSAETLEQPLYNLLRFIQSRRNTVAAKGDESLPPLLAFLHRQVAILTYPSYLEKVSFRWENGACEPR